MFFCRLEIFDGRQFDQWVDMANAPAIESSLKLYEEVQGLGFKVFLLTGRNEGQRAVTITNLEKAGFKSWSKLIMRFSCSFLCYLFVVWNARTIQDSTFCLFDYSVIDT